MFFKVTASAVTSLLLFAGFTSTSVAQPTYEQDINSAAMQLGLLKKPSRTRNNAYQPQIRTHATRPAPNQNTQQARRTVKPDPYAAKRQQIHQQNIARRKALQNRLANQRRIKYQRANQQQRQQQNRYGNVWNRVYQGFRIRNYNYHPLVKRYTSEFSRSPIRIQRLADRSADYLYMIVDELNRRRMPTELALLPFVESAYRNTAYSHAGAAGMWQFIPATGRRYGLQQTRSYDARLDPMQATRAALDYLQRLNREFRGDWLLSLAAYNAGEYRVHREIMNNRRRGLRTDYWNLSLPRETKQYVPRLLAYKEIFRNPRAFGIRLRGIPNTHALTTVHVNKAVDLRKAAAYAGLPSDTLTSINSGYLHGITTPRFSNKIILPRRYAGRLNKVIQRLSPAPDVHNKPAYRYAKAKKRKSRSRRSRHKRYRYVKVRRGDNLFRIAKKHGISVKTLKRINKLKSNKIKPGKRLKVASGKRRKSYS